MLDELGVTEKDHPARPDLERLSLPRPRHPHGGRRIRSRSDAGRIPLSLRPAIRAVQDDRLDRRGIRQCRRFRRALLPQRHRPDARAPTTSKSRSPRPTDRARMRADYVIGCDGGRSTVRKSPASSFEGFTYPERFIKIATPFDVATAQSQSGACAIISPTRTSGATCSRCAARSPAGCGARSSRSRRARTKKPRCGPSRSRRGCRSSFPSPAATRRDYVNVYGVHQRVASTFRTRPRAARRRFRPPQQPDRRHGHERRHPRRRSTSPRSSPASSTARPATNCSISTAASAATPR